MEFWQTIYRRLYQLEIIGEEEGLPISADSKSDFFRFIRKLNPSVRPYMSMLDNGNLRTDWRDDEGRQIGLQFLGSERVQYVFFFERKEDGSRHTEYGRVNRRFAMVKFGRMIKALGQDVPNHKGLMVLSDPLVANAVWPADLSPAIIANMPEENEPSFEMIGDVISETVSRLFPAVIS